MIIVLLLRFGTLGLLFVCFTMTILQVAAAQPFQYPPTRRIAHTDTYFGRAIEDPYHWLEDDHSEETKEWVRAENKVTFDYLADIPFRDAIGARLTQVENYAKYSAPFKRGKYLFYYKNTGLQNQSVLYIQDGEAGSPEVLIDPNTFSVDGTVRLTAFEVSKDGKYAVFGKTAIPGSDWVELHVMEMSSRRILDDTIQWVKFSGGAWSGDGFYYSRYPEPDPDSVLTVRIENRKVYFHRVGTDPKQDKLVYEDRAHPLYFVSVDTTEDERFAVLYISDNARHGNALLFRDDSKGDTSFTPIVTEITDDQYSIIDNEDSKFLVSTNNNAPNTRVMLFDPAHPAQANWKTLIREPQNPISGIIAAGGKLILTSLKDVVTHVDVYSRNGVLENRIEMPGPGTAYGFKGQKEDLAVYYVYESLNTPPSIFKYDIASKRTVLFRKPTITGYRSANYESREEFCTSKDGTRVPIFLTYKKGVELNGNNPTLLYGYGGFNITMSPTFSTMLVPWLEQGGVYAQVCLRGGGEYGEKWHTAGSRLNKQNVFDDCIAAAEWLLKHKYTSREKLAIQGGSNGGLLVAAVVNQRPELFRAAIPQVGVMDMLRFQKFTAGVAWIADYGSSDDETQFKYLLRYSPLHNIKEGVTYPAMLITTSDHDDRVVPAHSFKYAAALQAAAAPTRPVFIRIETNSGHGSSNLTKALEEATDVYAFLFKNLGVTPVYK